MPSDADLFGQIAELDAEADRQIERLKAAPEGKVECRRGCDFCCRRIVVAGVSEAVRIGEHVRKTFSASQKEALAARAAAYAADSLPFRDGRALMARPTCPFLVEGDCSIYELRPLACRGWNSYSARACQARANDPSPLIPQGDARQSTAAQALLYDHSRALAALGLSHHLVDLGLAAASLAKDPELTGRYLNGEPVLMEEAVILPGPDPILEERKRASGLPFEPSGILSRMPEPGHPAYEFLRLTTPTSYTSQDQIESSLARYRRLVDEFAETPMDPGEAFDGLSKFQTFGLPYTGEDVTDILRAVGEKIVIPVISRALPDLSEPLEPRGQQGRLRVGYLSRNMTQHHATAYTLGWIRNHAEDIESFVFHTGPTVDAVSLEFRRAADHFYHLPGDVPFSARFIKGLRLDVLVFPDIGNFGENFQYAGMRLAPVQCTGWGQPVTSGLPTIDYYLSSELMEPENGDEQYTESLVRLPGSGLFWPRDLPQPSGKSRSDLCLPDGPFVLVCQNLRKLIPKWDFLLAEVQGRTGLPAVLIDYGVEGSMDATRDRLAGLKTIWLPRQSQVDFLRIQQLAAVSLDPPAWSGGNTTVNGLGLGGPIVTLPGPFMRSRHSLAFMRQAKVDGLVATSPEEYVALAVDFDRLAKIMQGLDMGGVLEDHRVPVAVDEFLRSVSGRS